MSCRRSEFKKINDVQSEFFLKKSYFRKFFFDLDDKSEEGIDALTMADQSEASLKNLLELEDKDDELLLQLQENKAILKGR